MKLAVLSDIHGNITALETVLADLDTVADVDAVWVLGDIAAHGPAPAATTDIIRERYEAARAAAEQAKANGTEADVIPFKVIGGNTDRYLVTNARSARKPAEDADSYADLMRQYHSENSVLTWGAAQLGWANYAFLAKRIGREISEKVDGYGLVMGYHAVPGDDEYNITPDTPDEEALDSVLDRPLRLGIYGHIHRQVNRDLGRVRLVNPGSIGMSFEKPGYAQYAIITFEEGAVDVEFRNLPYDVDAVVALARAADHTDVAWLEKVLREGF